MTDSKTLTSVPMQTLFDAAVEANVPPSKYFFDWNNNSHWQFNLLRDFGLTPDSNVLDVGCGAMRLGTTLVPTQKKGIYAGIDAHRAYIETGKNIFEKIGYKIDESLFLVNAEFDLSAINHRFDFAISQSVLNHLSRERINSCLAAVKEKMKPGGIYVVTYNEIGTNPPLGIYYQNLIPMELPSFSVKEGEQYFLDLAASLNIKFEKLNCAHSTGQKVGAFYF